MTGFFIKKAFFDGWDNFMTLLLLNLAYAAVLLGIIGTFSYLTSPSWLPWVLGAVLLFVGCVYTGGVSGVVHQYARYSRGGWDCFLNSAKKQFSHSLLFFAIIGLGSLAFATAIPFYLQLFKGLGGWLLAFAVFWSVCFVLMALQYYFPLAQEFENDRPVKTLKKCFIMLADNFAFSLFFGLYSLFGIALSAFFALMLPGLGGVHLSQDVAVKLLMLKYDYLDENPGLGPKERRHLPWDVILAQEQERVGRRTLKGMIFPWKE